MFTEALRVKIKSLAAETKIIRFEEKRTKRTFDFETSNTPNPAAREYLANTYHEKLWKLTHHRIFDVRKETRATLIAYAFLRNKPYSSVENPKISITNNSFDSNYLLDRVVSMVNKYSEFKERKDSKELKKIIISWIDSSNNKNVIDKAA